MFIGYESFSIVSATMESYGVIFLNHNFIPADLDRMYG